MNAWILSVETRLPEETYSQDEALVLAGYTDPCNPLHRQAAAMFRSAGIRRRGWSLRGRPFCLADKDELHERHTAGLRALAPPAAMDAIVAAGLATRDIDFLVFATESGLTVPAFSMELAHTLGLGSDKATCNLLGFGCNALVPAMDLAATRVTACPGTRALVVCTEILTAYASREGIEAAVGNAIFGDGACAMVISSHPADRDRCRLRREHGAVPEIRRVATLRAGEHAAMMGLTFRGGQFVARLDGRIPGVVAGLVVRMVEALRLSGDERVILHPGGRKILDAIEAEVAVENPNWRRSIGWARKTMSEIGNVSSPTAAFVFRESLAQVAPTVDEPGAFIVMGPGISVEALTFVWR